MPGTKSVTVAYVLCALFAGVGAHRFYLQDWGKAFAKPACWLIGLWLTSNFLLFAGGGQYVLSGTNFRNCTNWAGPDTGVIAGGCWGRQTTAYQFWWVFHYINMIAFFFSYFVELCRMPKIVAGINSVNKKVLE